jgi:roadblock/LC7 domain-containing protein
MFMENERVVDANKFTSGGYSHDNRLILYKEPAKNNFLTAAWFWNSAIVPAWQILIKNDAYVFEKICSLQFMPLTQTRLQGIYHHFQTGGHTPRFSVPVQKTRSHYRSDSMI